MLIVITDVVWIDYKVKVDEGFCFSLYIPPFCGTVGTCHCFVVVCCCLCLQGFLSMCITEAEEEGWMANQHPKSGTAMWKQLFWCQ